MLARGVHARVVAAVATVMMLSAVLAAVGSSARAGAAPLAPAGLAPDSGQVVEASPVLTWDRVVGATGYDVEISDRADFQTRLYAVTATVNRRVTPTSQLPMTDLYWRVRARSGAETGQWSGPAAFSRNRLAGPVLRSPADAELLDQPDEPAVLRWDPVPGATAYTVELDRGPDADWVDTTTGTTKATTYTAIAIASGDWAWRVTATLASGQQSYPSTARTFTVGDLQDVTVTSPPEGQDLEDVVLDWDPVPGALRYEVRVSTDDEFATSNIVDTRLVKGTRYSPATTYDVDDYWWQVRAVDPMRVAAPWSSVPIHTFTRTWDPLPTTAGHGVDPQPAPDPLGAPRLLHPADTLSPAVAGDMYFQWTPVRHASSYRLDVGTNAEFSPGTFASCFTAHTTFTPESVAKKQCLPTLNTALYWRVKAIDDPKKVQGYYSPIGRFTYARDQVHLGPPADGAAVAVPTVAWEPVAGAEKYEVHVTSHAGADHSTITYSTSWTVPDPLDPADGPFEWQVEAISADKVKTPATINASTRSFTLTGSLPHSGAPPLTPLGQGAAATARFPSLAWEPMPGAATYRLWVGTAGTDTFSQVPGTFAYPAATDTSARSIAGGTYAWFVEAFDLDDHSLGTSPTTGSFTVLDPPVVTGEQIALRGTSLDAGTTCTASLLDVPAQICPTTAGTPVLDWQPDPDVASYIVYVSRDRNFQNMVYGTYSDPTTLPSTSNTRWTATATLPESQAGTAYYWYIRPCKAAGVCAADPLQADHAFEKRSPQVLTDPVAETADDITFTWQDYLVTNRAAAPHPVTGERSDQEARAYQLQVSATVGFDRVIDDVEVDQPTYTAFTKLYPEGTLYWRVRAYDGDDRALPWSETRAFVKSSPPPTPIAPTGTVAITEALRWAPSPFAVSYDVEAYRQADTTASVVNRVVKERTSVAAYAPSVPLPSGTDYAWRVRGIDDSGNAGAWSSWATYRIEGRAPTLESPGPGATVPTADGLFSWQAVPGATTYRFERREPAGAVREAVTTAALAWAPTSKVPSGRWEWRVTATDAGGAAISATPWRDVTVQAGPVAVSPPVVTGSGTVGELLHATAPTWDLPDVTTAYQWLRNGSVISGATGVDYEVVAADLGRSISARATGVLPGYDAVSTTSNAITGVVGPTVTASSPPTVEGTGQVGTTLVAALPTWDDPVDLQTYRWLRNGVAATTGSLTYRVRESDLGASLAFQVTGKRTGYLDTVLTTADVLVGPAPAPTPTVAPRITGSARVGHRLGVDDGAWGAGYRFAHQWLRDGRAIAGATGSTYLPVAADAARDLSVVVSATRTGHATGVARTAGVKVARMASSTEVGLPSLRVIAHAGRKAKVRATVTVTVPGSSRPRGRVRVYDGKRLKATAALRGGGVGVVRLTGLGRGRHRLVARYVGTTTTAPSTSARIVLTVV